MASIIPRTALNPLVTGPLFLILAGKAPQQITEPVLDLLRQHLSADAIGRAITALKWLTVLGIGRYVHGILNAFANSNFQLRSQKHRYNWPEEVAVVTGAAGGFGRLMSLDLASKGLHVVAVDIVDSLPKDMQGNSKITYYQCDITDRDAVMSLAERVKKAHGDPSILINNAGIAGKEMDVMSATPEMLNRIYGVNVICHYYTIQAFMPAMIRAKKGHVVTIASLASFVSGPGMTPYSGTKAAVLAMHEGLKAEARVIHKAPELQFTVVHPTFADTALVAPYKDDLKTQGMLVLDPKVVSDAVVSQVMSGRGAQIFVPRAYGLLAGLRGWPHYITQTLVRLGENERSAQTVLKNSGKVRY